MDTQLLLTIGSVLLVFCYFVVTWLIDGVDPKPGTMVVRYSPPRGLSPALLRYVWKEEFDDRAVWAAALNLAANGSVTIQSDREGGTNFMPVSNHWPTKGLAEEEKLLLFHLKGNKKGSASRLDMTDPATSSIVARMSGVLKSRALGKWFNLNRPHVLTGAVLSIFPIAVAANPHKLDEWLGLIVAIGAMFPGSFYLLVLLRRLHEMIRTTRTGVTGNTIRRLWILICWAFVLSISIILGLVILGFNFGVPVLLVLILLVLANLSFLFLIKAPTIRGRKLLDEIEGFRTFLQSVEQLPLDRPGAPEPGEQLYKRYLPYAVALEVEQAWGDRCVAFASTTHSRVPEFRAHTFYLGMWDGQPVEIVCGPRGNNKI